MIAKVKSSWHRFWYYNYNFLLEKPLNDKHIKFLLKQSIYHRNKIIERL